MDATSILQAVKLALETLSAGVGTYKIIDELIAKLKLSPKATDPLIAQLAEAEAKTLQARVAAVGKISGNERYSNPEKDEARLRLAHQLLHTIEVSRDLFKAHNVATDEIESFCRSLIKTLS